MFGNAWEIEIIACDGLFATWLSHSSRIAWQFRIKKLRRHSGYLTMHRHTTLQVKEQHKMTEEWANQQGREVSRDHIISYPSLAIFTGRQYIYTQYHLYNS